MQIDFDSLSPNQRYHLFTQTIIPRPVAWVLSENEDESLNLAPFSFFNAMSSDPALLVISIGKKEGGERKDSARNIISGREFIIHIANSGHAEAVSATSAPKDYGDSEVDDTNLELCEFEGGKLPRLTSCDIAYRCSLYEQHFVGPNKQAFIYAQVHSLFLSDHVATQDGQRITVDPAKIDPLTRLGGANFAKLGPIFKTARPK